VKELHRAGVNDVSTSSLDEESARDLIAEIRSEEID
jgi:hypothetical protein